MGDHDFIQSPVFICGHRKTGTTLFLSLLDNHQELTVYPSDSGFFYLYHPLFDTNSKSKTEKIDRMVERVIGMIKEDLGTFLEKNEQQNLDFPMDRLVETFKNIADKTDCTPKDMLKSLFTAFKQVWQPDIQSKAWIEKTTSSEIYASDILNWFPHAKFIHIVRDPRDNWASLQSGWKARYQNFNESKNDLMQSLLDRCLLGLKFARMNQRIYGKNIYKVIRFEDLVSNSLIIMKEVADFIGITMNDDLLQPTFLGVPWRGNNFDGLKFKGISDKNKSRWKERISEEDAALIEFYFEDLMNDFDYKLEIDPCVRSHVAKQHYKWFNFSEYRQNN